MFYEELHFFKRRKSDYKSYHTIKIKDHYINIKSIILLLSIFNTSQSILLADFFYQMSFMFYLVFKYMMYRFGQNHGYELFFFCKVSVTKTEENNQGGGGGGGGLGRSSTLIELS